MDDREKDEEKNHSQTNSAEDVGHEVSEEALQEREHRSIVYTTPAGVSKGTDTSSRHFLHWLDKYLNVG